MKTSFCRWRRFHFRLSLRWTLEDRIRIPSQNHHFRHRNFGLVGDDEEEVGDEEEEDEYQK